VEKVTSLSIKKQKEELRRAERTKKRGTDLSVGFTLKSTGPDSEGGGPLEG